MNLGIKGRKAIICASSKGLGKACAMTLARDGVHVFINGRNTETLEATAKEIRDATGSEVTAVACDVTTNEGREKLLAACPEPDILITLLAHQPETFATGTVIHGSKPSIATCLRRLN